MKYVARNIKKFTSKCEMLLPGVEKLRQKKAKPAISSVSAYNGNHSSYTGNTLTVEALA